MGYRGRGAEMRLIDGKELADEILGKIYERGQASGIWEEQLEIGAITYRDIEFANGYDHALDDIYRRINNAPTVNAIPIEWVKEELDYARKMYDNSTELTEPYWRGNVSALEVLIIRWEKENEQR